MTNGERTPLHELYNRVCAKRTEAVVPERNNGFRSPLKLLHMSERWWWTNEHGEGRCVYDEDASAIILQHWLGLLPEGWCLIKMRMSSGEMRWAVNKDMDDTIGCWAAPTPVEVLAAYLEAQ